MPARPAIDVDLAGVILAVTNDQPRLLARAGAPPRLPSGRFDPVADSTLDRGARRWVRDQTGLEVGYVEQLYTFGDRDRGAAAQAAGGGRLLSVAYLALVREEQPAPGATWLPIYQLFPWEDHRLGRPAVIPEVIAPALLAWAAAAPDEAERVDRTERAQVAFGLGQAAWDEVRALERYELLYEAGLVAEYHADRGEPAGAGPASQPMALDHRRIAATAVQRLRGKLGYRPVVFELLPQAFTLLALQRVVEALAGVRLHKQNFRRTVERAGLVEGTGRYDTATGGRPAELFSFRHEVLRERPRSGVPLPGR